jgi:hypothetical protein
MEIPVFEHQSRTGETTTGQEHTQTETIPIKETTMQSNDKTLPPDIQEKIIAFQDKESIFLEWRGKLTNLQAKAAEQINKAMEKKAEADQLGKAITDAVRDGSLSDGEIETLALKQATAANLVTQYQKYAAELDKEKDQLENHALVAANEYSYAWGIALSAYVDYEFNSIMEDIKGRWLMAVKLKKLAYDIIPNKSILRLQYDLKSRGITEAAINDVANYLKPSLQHCCLDNTNDSLINRLGQRPNVSPLSWNRVTDHGTIHRAQKNLRNLVGAMDSQQTGG